MLYKNEGKVTKSYKLNGVFVSALPGKVLNLPPNIGDADSDMVLVNERKKEAPADVSPSVPSNEELKKFTKDELNDLAAKLGHDALNSKMSKKKMLESLKEFLER